MANLFDEILAPTLDLKGLTGNLTNCNIWLRFTETDGDQWQYGKQLRPLVDGGTIVTLAGCKVASNAVGRRLLSEIGGLLGVRTQGFVEDQYVSALRPGIEGQTISCGASVCRPSSVTPFASTIYGSPEAYGNVDPGWE